MPPADPLAGQLVGERYRLQHRIGSGGMSLVYLAEQLDGAQPVAIKFLRSAFANLPDFVRRFEQEARASRLLNHRNCLHVLDHGFAFGSPYLVMEYVGGTSLAELLAAGPLPTARALALTQQILAGLDHAHAQGVVHRDLKPQNIMLAAPTSSEELVKLVDFGTAQLLTSPSVGSMTEVGTPWYMAPEQVCGQPTGPATDLYAVGVMLFEMLTGTRPFVAEDPLRVLQMHLSSPIPSARALRPELGLSPELEAVLRKALQKATAERYSSAEEFAAALAQTPESQPRRPAIPRPAPATPPPALEPEPAPLEHHHQQSSSRRSLALVLVAAGGLLLVLLLVVILRGC